MVFVPAQERRMGFIQAQELLKKLDLEPEHTGLDKENHHPNSKPRLSGSMLIFEGVCIPKR